MNRPGFFSLNEIQKTLPEGRLPKCAACQLHLHCRSPKMPLSGNGRQGILIVGEGPGEDEDREGRQFVGRTGELLQRKLSHCGINMRRDCWLINAINCRKKNNATPSKDEIEHCRPLVLNAIHDLQPRVVLLLGTAAVRSVIGHLWKEDPGGVTRWAGWTIPSQRLNAWVCPNFHPSFVAREKPGSGTADLWFTRYLQKACRLAARGKRPWKTVPDYTKKVERLYEDVAVVEALKSFVAAGRPVCFDYETNRLKPDDLGAEIICCAVSDGRRTIAYPWSRRCAAATKNLLRSSVPKIAQNLKFEERWTRKLLGVSVRNWDWDTMLATHWLDNRSKITSIKFQAFVLLGTESYDDHIKPYLQAAQKGGNENNSIHKLDQKSLLLYCGLDALIEYKVAMMQKKRFTNQGV